MKVGDLVRLRDSDYIHPPWRGQLVIIMGPGELDVPNRFEIKRLHDGKISYASKYLLEEAPDASE